MRETVIKFQIERMEQELSLLKTKMIKKQTYKTLSGLYGVFEGKMDFSIEEIKEHEYLSDTKI